MRATVFLGGGRITSALIAGLRIAGYKKQIIVHDRNPQKLRQLKREYGVTVEPDLKTAVWRAGLLVIAVRPGSVRELLGAIKTMGRKVVAVSLAAGIPLARLVRELGPPVQWARAMPSPVCRSGRGLTAVTFPRDLNLRARSEIRRFFGQVGSVLEVPEAKFDVFTVTYSSSHGYHALATLAAAAEKLGLDRNTALSASAHALADGIQYWREGNGTLRELLHEAATPGGIAATVMDAMDDAGYPRIVERALRAGRERARANAKR